jgi:protein ImuB
MRWIALHWPSEREPELSREALAWWGLRFTPHVAWVDEALLLEVAGCERLWGGRRALLRRLAGSSPTDALPCMARGATSLVALAQLRLRVAGQTPAARARDFPLWTLSAARPHRPVLERLGCRTWGQVDALPRAGLARRFGVELGRALDVALERAPDVYPWAALPERFEQALDLPQRADSAPALLWTGRRLLALLQQWLAARGWGVLALELSWRFDQLRLNGRELPPVQSLTLRTAEPMQTMRHIERLLAERLERTALLAPACSLGLRVLQTAPWRPQTTSFLPEDQPRGDPLHVFVERASARFGPDCVRAAVARNDHRLGCRQGWQSAAQALLQRRQGQGVCAGSRPALSRGRAMPAAASDAGAWSDALSPTWLLRPPRALSVKSGRLCHEGRPLHCVAGPCRVESGWWTEAVAAAEPGGAPVARDYFVARDAAGGLLLIYRERPVSASLRHGADGATTASLRWFLEGLYA